VIRHKTQGAPKKKSREKKNEVGTMVPSFEFFLRFSSLVSSNQKKKNIFVVFLGSSCRETAKNTIKKIEGKRRQEKKNLNFFGQKFLTRPSPKTFFGVFDTQAA
jgi:hypothetical protein